LFCFTFFSLEDGDTPRQIMEPLWKRRAQNLPGWTGQRRENDNFVPVSNERGRPHVTHHWEQRGGGGVEQHPLHHVGSWRPGVAENLVEHILQQYRVHHSGGG